MNSRNQYVVVFDERKPKVWLTPQGRWSSNRRAAGIYPRRIATLLAEGLQTRFYEDNWKFHAEKLTPGGPSK